MKKALISRLRIIAASLIIPTANGSRIQAIGRRLTLGIAGMAILTASTIPAFADGPGWTVNSTVIKLVVTANGGINVRLSPDLSNCVSQSGYGPLFASVYPTHPGINRMKADLLAAYLSGKTVSLYLSDSTCTAVEMVLGGW